MRVILITAILFFLLLPGSLFAENEIRLIVRGDDIGSFHAANLACIKTCKEGIVQSLEVMVPAPWFTEAAAMLNENPSIDVGVHLTLTSEWDNCKWRPLTGARSFVDSLGNFLSMTSQRQDFPPKTGFIQSGYKIEEVEKELRAQIENAKSHIKNVSHLSSHMGTPTCMPDLLKVTEKLAKEYQLPLEMPSAKYLSVQGWESEDVAKKEAAFIKALENLKPGLWLVIDHPGFDCDEMRTIGHKGYEKVAQDRDRVTKVFTSPKVKEVIQKRGIKLVSYGEVNKSK